MTISGKTVAITGASGLVGRYIFKKLHASGCNLRVLSRSNKAPAHDATLIAGDINDTESLQLLLDGAEYVFHCAAELKDESIMWDVNVNGTKTLLQACERVGIKHLSYLSSAGVIGMCQTKLVDESTECKPTNMYEKSKCAAEQLVLQGVPGCSISILRPTNVVDSSKPGALAIPMSTALVDRLKVVIKGGECAHIVHAEDVADAAIFLSSREYQSPELFFVACDEEPLNTVAGLWSLCRNMSAGLEAKAHTTWHLPIALPYLIRKLQQGYGNMGDIRYSSQKLLVAGFSFKLGVNGAVKQVMESCPQE